MKKICMITTVSITMKAFVVEMAKHLYETCGYDITLICCNDEEFTASLPEYLHFIPVHMERGIKLSGFKAIGEFCRIFHREKFDMVQYATPNASCYASIAAKMERVPVRLYCQWGIRYVGLSGISRTVFKKLEKMICSLSTHIRAQSIKNMKFAIDEKLCPKNKIAVIGIGGTIGVDLKECDRIDTVEQRMILRKKYNIPYEAFVFGYVGRISKDKGINELIKAFKVIKENYPNAYVVFVGDIDSKDPINNDLMLWAQSDSKMVFTGSVPSSEVYSYMSIMDVLVHPTYREGFGKVIQEGMGMSLPVITTDIPGPSEVIENGISGILVKVRDSLDLAEKMEMLLNDEITRKRFSLEGRKRVEKYFDRPVMLENIKQEMIKILGE